MTDSTQKKRKIMERDMKRGQRTASASGTLRKTTLRGIISLLLLLLTATSAWATDYVFVYNGNYLGVNAAGTGIQNYQTFDPERCVWTCVNGNNEATLGGTSYALRITYNGNTRYLNGSTTNGNAPTLSTTAQNVWRLNGGYLAYHWTSGGGWNQNYAYLYYRGSSWRTSSQNNRNNNNAYSYGTDYRATSTASSPSSAVDNTTLPTISCSGLSGSTGLKMDHTNLGGTYIPATTTITIGGTTYYKGTNGVYSETAPTVTFNPTYRWSIVQGGTYATINETTGVLTLRGNPTTNQTIRVQLATTNIAPLADQTATYDLTLTAASANNNLGTPTVSCTGLSGSAGLQLAHTNISGKYVPQHSTFTVGGTTYYYYNGQIYNNTDAFATTVDEGDVTYAWSVTSGNATITNAGVLTLTSDANQTITVRCRATASPNITKDATYTLTATATAALNETVYGEMTITPASTMLDLGGTSTYTASASISKLTRTRPQYVTITDQQSHTHYKVGTTYQASVPAITETPESANFTQIGWSFSGGEGNYYNPSTYSSQSTNELVLTRTATITGTQQTFTITATGRYDGWEGPVKTANATVTIPLTQVDITNLYPGEALALGMGEVGSVVGHYSWQPNDPSAGQTYTNFKYTSNSTSIATVDASGNVTAVGPGSTTITITAVKLDGTDGVRCNVTVNVAIDPPAISIDGSGNVTITHPVPGVQIRYTTNGTNPTANTGTVYNASFTANNEQTIKAIAVSNGVASAVVSEFYVKSGISGTKVIINDYEDHNWTYYQKQADLPEGYPVNYLSSPDPRNVKITYRGGSVNNASAVAISGLTGENQNEMVYYKTLEKTVLGMTGDYPYQVISNPFSKRPRTNGTTGTNGFWGFAGWKVISGGEYIAEHANNDVLGLDEIIHFTNLDYNYTPNCTSGEIVFEATWTAATVKTGKTVQTFTGGTYETNFWVITDNTGDISLSSPCTMSARYPNGTSAGNYSIGAGRGTNITTTVDNVKIEFLNLNTTGNISADGRNFTMGRGITWSRTAGRITCGNRARAHTVKIESGKYGSLYHFTATVSGAATNQFVVLGNDYDRAKKDNTKLEITGQMIDANANTVTGVASQCYVRSVVKSGSFMTEVSVGRGLYTESYYFGGYGSNNRHTGRRFLTLEGGEFTGSVCGGTDAAGHGATARAFDMRVRGNVVINGSVYGGAENALCYGIRTMVFTGGTIKGWVCGAANGTTTNQGNLTGTTYLYIGGNAQVDSEGDDTKINGSIGGNVFAAGCGTSTTSGSSSGRVDNGTNLVIADNSYIERGAYGGGALGSSKTDQTTNIFITGGHVAGNNGCVNGSDKGGVFGGACQQGGGAINITMTGGLIEGGLFGGSNTTGTIALDINMNINGGQVGKDAEHTANIHGGGYGQNTVVSRNIDITLGTAPNADGVVVYGDVYGGSALGSVNGETATNTYHTNVTMNAGYIHGSLYGGALGSNTVAANVYGPVAVTVNGGVLRSTNQGGLGAVFGCNNMNGRPLGKVTVDVTGGEMEYIYGGGNAAPYTVPTPNSFDVFHVHMSGGLVHKHIFGGGLGTNAVLTGNTEVKVTGGSVVEGNVYGGGNGALVTGDTHIVIGD